MGNEAKLNVSASRAKCKGKEVLEETVNQKMRG